MREAALLSLCFDLFADKRTIVFFRTKASAHRMALIFRLLEISHSELHGNLTQSKRLEALETFHSDASIRILLCSELASRGLDIINVDLVINFGIPPTTSRYVHQVCNIAYCPHLGIWLPITFPGREDRKNRSRGNCIDTIYDRGEARDKENYQTC